MKSKTELDQVAMQVCPVGWAYTGQGTHKKRQCFYFQSGCYATGYKEIICYDEDLTEKNLLCMVKYNVTR